MAYRPSDRAGLVFGELRKLGYPEHVAAALTGNIIQESGHKLRPDAVGDGGAAYGMVQWNGPRKRAYLRWAEANGFDPADTKAQVRYLDHELKTTERGARDAIMKASTLEDATRLASDKFWRPGVPMMNNRLRYAAGVMNNYGGGVINVADTGDARREALMKEARKRGLVKDSGAAEDAKTRREMLMEEARKRGLLKGPDDAARIQEKAAIESAVGQVLAEGGRDPKVVADENAARDLRLSYAEPDPVEQPAGAEPDAVISPTDLLRASPPGMIIAEVKRYLPPTLQNALDQVVKGSSFNWSDEMTGAANAVVSGTEEETFGQEYRRFTDAERARADKFREDNPALATGAEIGGALATAPLFGVSGAARGVVGRVALGAAEGAGAGAFAAAGESRTNEEVAGDAMRGAAGGAVLGAALTRAGISLERYMAGRAALKAANTSDDIAKAGARLIDSAENSGVIYKPEALTALRDNLIKTMDDEVIRAGVDDASYAAYRAIIKDLDDALDRNAPMTLKRLAKMEALAWRAWKKAGREGSDERLAAMLAGKVDDFVADTKNMVVESSAAATRNEGAALWRQHKKFREIEDLIAKATIETNSVGSGGNINNKLRQAFAGIAKRPQMMKRFSPEEQEAIKAVVDQGITAGTLRLIGKLSPGGNGLTSMLQLWAAVNTGGWSALSIPAAAAAKKAADVRTTARAQKVLATILQGARPQPAAVKALNGAERRAIARALSQHYGETVGEGLGVKLPAEMETSP